MNKLVYNEAWLFVERNRNSSGLIGRNIEESEILQLREKLNDFIPDWFVDLIVNIPITNIEFGFQEYEADDEFDGISYISWNDPKSIINESIDLIPGSLLLKKGYLCIASCSLGSGDQVFISLNDGDNPPVYRVNHDYASNIELLLTEGISKISNSLSELFSKAIFEEE